MLSDATITTLCRLFFLQHLTTEQQNRIIVNFWFENNNLTNLQCQLKFGSCYCYTFTTNLQIKFAEFKTNVLNYDYYITA